MIKFKKKLKYMNLIKKIVGYYSKINTIQNEWSDLKSQLIQNK